MTGKLTHINLKYPQLVAILIGAPEVLVGLREYCGKHLKKRAEGYFTNREIKTWAAWFLLRSLTKACKIQQWRRQSAHLTAWLQMCEGTLWNRLKEMERMGLVELRGSDIYLASYLKAARILGITYQGQTKIPYNHERNSGNQIFQYYIRAEEFRSAQEKQLNTLMYYLNKDENASDLSELKWKLKDSGADGRRLDEDPAYLQACLLDLQLRAFREASEILPKVAKHRPDINRGVERIQRDHNYKAASCVSYMKRRMVHLGIILVQKRYAESYRRARLWVPDGPGKDREGYKYRKAAKSTLLFLTDQITFQYELPIQNGGEKPASNAA